MGIKRDEGQLFQIILRRNYRFMLRPGLLKNLPARDLNWRTDENFQRIILFANLGVSLRLLFLQQPFECKHLIAQAGGFNKIKLFGSRFHLLF
jgi:hypothetical protein